jgi:heme exporter protein D
VAFSLVLAVRWHRGAWRRIRVLETPEEEEAREARAAAETSSPA